MTSADEFGEWYEGQASFFQRGLESLERSLTRFCDDWESEYNFRFDKVAARVKGQSRLYEKFQSKGLDNPDQLFAKPYPIRDILGGRIVMRSIRDVRHLKEAIESNFPYTILQISDTNDSPTKTGYRAIHIDGLLDETVRDQTRSIPFELQIKTLLQVAWGDFTHGAAYARTDVNTDARFKLIRELQRIMAAHLDVADQWQANIEHLSEDALHQIASSPIGNELNVGNVLNSINQDFEELISLSDAQTIVEVARSSGIDSIEELRATVSQIGSDQAAEISDSLRKATGGRQPRSTELVRAMLRYESVTPPGKLLVDSVKENIQEWEFDVAAEKIATNPQIATASDEHGWGVLHYAAWDPYGAKITDGESSDFIRTTVAAGANVNARTSTGQTALGLSCRYIRDDEIASEDDSVIPSALTTLIELGADINLTPADGISCLHVAAATCDLAMASALISAGANVNSQSTDESTIAFDNHSGVRAPAGSTPLHLGSGATSMVSLLVANGARPDIANADGKRPADFVVETRNLHADEKAEILELLRSQS